MTGDLRALTIRQPWAEAVADGHKPTENRSQGFPKRHRGLVLIHAAKGWSVRGQRDERVREHYRIGDFVRMHYQLGAVLAVADLVDVHPAAGCCAPWGEETYPPANPEARPPGIVTHLTFDHPVRLPHAIPARGALGLWRPDDDLTLEVAHALASLVSWDLPGATAVAERSDVEQLWHLLTEADA